MPSRRQPPPRSRGIQRTESTVARDEWASLPVLPLLCLGVAIVVELFLYFGDAPHLTLEQRKKCLYLLAAPDQLFVLWCGEKLAYFSLFDRWPIALSTVTILVTAWLAGRLLLFGLGVARLL